MRSIVQALGLGQRNPTPESLCKFDLTDKVEPADLVEQGPATQNLNAVAQLELRRSHSTPALQIQGREARFHANVRWKGRRYGRDAMDPASRFGRAEAFACLDEGKSRGVCMNPGILQPGPKSGRCNLGGCVRCCGGPFGHWCGQEGELASQTDGERQVREAPNALRPRWPRSEVLRPVRRLVLHGCGPGVMGAGEVWVWAAGRTVHIPRSWKPLKRTIQ